jgi:hypothetical protein
MRLILLSPPENGKPARHASLAHPSRHERDAQIARDALALAATIYG